MLGYTHRGKVEIVKEGRIERKKSEERNQATYNTLAYYTSRGKTKTMNERRKEIR